MPYSPCDLGLEAFWIYEHPWLAGECRVSGGMINTYHTGLNIIEYTLLALDLMGVLSDDDCALRQLI